MTFIRVLFVFWVFVISGCASVDSQKEGLAMSSVCCKAYADMPVAKLAVEGTQINFGPSDPVFQFPLGRSRFRTFELPAKLNPGSTLVVNALGQAGNVYTKDGSWAPYFHPAVTFLDNEKIATSTYTEKSPTVPPDSCVSLFRCGVALISVPIPSAAKFVVIHTPFDAVGRTRNELLSGVNPDQTYVINGAYVTLPGHARKLRAIGMATGIVDVRVVNFSVSSDAPVGLATLYVMRPHADPGTPLSPVTYLNGVKVIDLKDGAYTKLYVSPGTYSINTEKGNSINGLGNVPGEFTVSDQGKYFLAFITDGNDSRFPPGTVPISDPKPRQWLVVPEAAAVPALTKMFYIAPETKELRK
ncbi:MAG: hypothetical protein PHS32_00745 [Rhodoferax sp.]|uniref:hypothetical protein n=1 Tax=Rhodoferax sp. TaxID=50421 RepID=UPI0026016EC9|nr:hypothetical protein [Rhodoferax sp.]MDD5332245.1 hypothetical protein [Rhodoferax sp.]